MVGMRHPDPRTVYSEDLGRRQRMNDKVQWREHCCVCCGGGGEEAGPQSAVPGPATLSLLQSRGAFSRSCAVPLCCVCVVHVTSLHSTTADLDYISPVLLSADKVFYRPVFQFYVILYLVLQYLSK